MPWKQPLLNLTKSFNYGEATVENDQEDHETNVSDLLAGLNTLQLGVLLYFAGTLAEEVGRVDANAHSNARLHAQMQDIVKDASLLMSWSFGQPAGADGSAARTEALRTFLTWVNYAQPVWPRNPEALQHLRSLVELATQCLLDETLFQEALDVFRDILESYTSFFQPQHMDMLAQITHDYIQPYLLRALSDQDSDGLLLGQFVIAFGCANVQQVVEQPNNELGSEMIVKLHLEIISTDGYPGDEDQISTQSIEFWNTYIEYVNDTLFSKDQDHPDPTWMPQAKYIMEQVVDRIWRKMWTPPNDVAKTWGDAESEGFKEYRLDASDLILSIYLFLGKDMLRQLVTLTVRSLEAEQWRAIEAALFCLDTLADNVVEDAQSEELVGEIFRSSLFRDIADFSQNVPSQARRTAIDMLGSYGQYIERHAEFLPDTLRFLFASLEMAGLASAAAKSIASLCYSCRGSLTNELEGFLAQYRRFLNSKTCDPYTKDKVIGAIAAIVQAIAPESAKARPLLALLENVEEDVFSTKQYATAGDEEMAELMGVNALECLASIGKGMQVPEDIPIDIYDDDEEKEFGKPSYWDSAEGCAIQQRIVGCFSVLQVVGKYSAAIEAACQVLRSGFTETEPGPFVLPASVTVNFVQQCSIRTPQLEMVLSTACVLITQHSRNDTKRIDTDVAAMYRCAVAFIQALGVSSNDPGVAMGCVDVFGRMMPYYTHILFGELVLPFTLDFTLSAIEGPDTLPKRSAGEFWTKLVKPQAAATSDDVQRQIVRVMDVYGPRLANSLIHQIGGQAQRSDLDMLCEPLKGLLLHQGSAQMWLQNGLDSDSFPSSSVSIDDKTRFLRQLMSSGSDGRKVKDLVRAFWAACRGTVVSYNS